MSPGIDDGPRNTGTLPKSNRRNDRNRERSAANQQIANRSAYHGHPQHFNNLFQLDWQPVNERERESSRTAKNSNTRSATSVPSYFYQDLSDFGRPHNCGTEAWSWRKMVPPIDPRTQSPPRVEGTKPSNVNKMPDRNQIESRLNQIREYIKVTATMMDSLSLSSDPRAQAQNEKLGRMVEDLHDSESKLSKLLEQCHNHGVSDENSENGREDMDERSDTSREMQLRRNVEEYQSKLAQLQEHQTNLVGMQMRFRERLNEARQAQQMLLQQENQNTSLPGPANVEQLESETEVLRGKLAQLQTKKKHMDHLVAELQAIEAFERGSSSSEGSRNTIRDKAAELEAMKTQLAHIKALMEDSTKIRDSVDSTSELEQDVDVNSEDAADLEITEDENAANISFERQSDSDDIGHGKIRNFSDRPTIEDVEESFLKIRDLQTMRADLQRLKQPSLSTAAHSTSSSSFLSTTPPPALKEQSISKIRDLQATRAELQRLKQPSLPTTAHSTSLSSFPSTTPPPTLTPSSINEKKQSNNVSTDTQQAKRRQLEDLIKKEQTQPSNVNRDIQGPDLNSQRSSGSQTSHTSTPANVWLPSAVIGGSNEQSVDGVSMSENLLDVGPQTAAIENGFPVNWWSCPLPPINPVQHASAEYYRQLILGSQAQQLQMMNTTIHQCCHLLWAQQRELQSMRTAIIQLQLQLRQNQPPQRASNAESQEEYSNLSRSVHHLGDTLDATLPPSSSLPNLVSLPNSSAALSHTPVVTTNSQQQQQQLNNQVPPGNRANNYWDNFRSYSRQNLLSGNVKTITDTSTAVTNSASSANTIGTSGNSVNSSLMKDKRNREQGTDNLPIPLSAEAQYSLNLQLPSNLQQQDRENTTIRSNIIANEVSQQVDNIWEEAYSSFRLPSTTNDDNLLHNLSSEMKEALSSLIAVNKRRPDYLIIILREIKAISEDHRLRPQLLRSLRALQDTQTLMSNPLNEVTDLTPSESCQSSDEDSDVGAILGFGLENQSSATELVATSHVIDTASSPASQVPLIDHLDISGTFSLDCASALPSTSNGKSGYNEDLAEADQSRPESSGNQKPSTIDTDNEEGQEEAASCPIGAEAITPDLESLAAKTEDERADGTELDKFYY
ncbi:uncharacterized protein LOC116848373 isoform X2 [Odontomachus brunneus]|uniref:uncharacterized protein LOC116848373 isoform X2 n=1 Tax=Odontomachus brunneus TaxID=486640 RepID=UPI0013F2AB08|nr:uncharacterized protein LOC116848373 isoform X2 [Odontomachus brunneus]